MGKSKYPPLNDPGWLRKKYWEEGLSTYKIAKIVGCSSAAVRNAMKKLGVPRRALSERNEGDKNPMYGKHHSEETKRKIEKKNRKEGISKGDLLDLYWNQGLSTSAIAKHYNCSSETIRHRLIEYGIPRRPPSKGNLNKKFSLEHRKKIAEAKKGTHLSPETREKVAKASRERWASPEFVEKMMEAWKARPNKVEKLAKAILQKIQPGEWAYNGDFSCGVSIGRMIPDFVNINGKKAVIEVFSDWHNEKFMREKFGRALHWKRTEFGRKAAYAQLGYKCVILWEKELKKDNAEGYVLGELKKGGLL